MVRCTLEDGLQFMHSLTTQECGTWDHRTWRIGTWAKSSTSGFMTQIPTPPRSAHHRKISSYVVSTYLHLFLYHMLVNSLALSYIFGWLFIGKFETSAPASSPPGPTAAPVPPAAPVPANAPFGQTPWWWEIHQVFDQDGSLFIPIYSWWSISFIYLTFGPLLLGFTSSSSSPLL